MVTMGTIYSLICSYCEKDYLCKKNGSRKVGVTE